MKFLAFDTEDDSRELMAAGRSGFDKRVTQLAAIGERGAKFHNRGDVAEFVRWLRQRPEQYIYAHNLQYDLGNIFKGKLDSLDMTLVKGRLIKARWGNKEFRDSFNLWPMALSKVGRAFGLEKLEFDSEGKDYVFRDVEIVRAAVGFVREFCAQHGIKRLPTTLGGLAMASWAELGGENCTESGELARRALYGGRVELFRPHATGRIVYTDINSLYPSAMLGEFPGPLSMAEGVLPPHGVVEASVNVPAMEIPILPWRRDDGAVLFPVGRFRGVWTVPELRYAMQQGVVVERVYEGLGTDEVSRPYAEWIQTVYQRRQAAKTPAESLLWKLVLNNLYGRLGTGGVITRSVTRNERTEKRGVAYGGKVLVDYAMPLDGSVNWAHAAYVTAYGRIALHKHLLAVGAKRLIYCDTDSCIFQWGQRDPLPFTIGPELGQMKLEGEATRATTYAPKAYRFGAKARAKGVPQRLADDFLRTGRAEFDLPFRLRESVAFYDRADARQLSVWRRVIRERQSGYDKKRFRGGHFHPIRLRGD